MLSTTDSNTPSTLEKNYEKLKRYAFSWGASLFGVADIREHKEHIHIYPPHVLEGLDKAISMAIHLSDDIFETIVDRPNRLYFRHYKMSNIFLDTLAIKVGEVIQREGYRYLPIPASVVLDWEGLSSHASHRAIAVLAGLGWRGRSSLLVTPQYGARVRLVSLLTNYPIKVDQPIDGGCGRCRRCVDMCPAGAIGIDHFDLEACHEMLKHFGKTIHVSLICGVCQKACTGNNPLWDMKEGDKGGRN